MRLSIRSKHAPLQISAVEIYFGTMFGNAERFARSLAYEIMTKRRIRVTVHDLDTFNEHSLLDPAQLTASRLYVFVVSTHFTGAPSPSGERFHKWIESLLMTETPPPEARRGEADAHTVADSKPRPSPPKHDWKSRIRGFTRSHRLSLLHGHNRALLGMQYTVFGVGDSAYLTYNATGKFVDLKLKQLGASRFTPLGLGDCSGNLDESFKTWQASLLHKLPQGLSFSQLPGVNFASTLATVTYGRFRSKRKFSVVPSANGSKTASLQGRPSNEPASVISEVTSAGSKRESPLHTTSVVVRDNFGRNVHMRFQCIIVAGPVHNISTAPAGELAARGPRTPRVALFDSKPFAEVVPIAAIGISTSTVPSSRQRASGIFRVQLLNTEVSYTTANTLAIFPHNCPRDVDAIAEAFGFDLDAVIKLEVDETHYRSRQVELQALRQQIPFPTPCSVRTALTEFLEIGSVTREFIRIASGFVVTSDERDLLEDLASTDGSSAICTQIQQQHKGVVDILAMAPTLQIPLEVFVNITPTIKPRYFTIASSPKVSPRHLDLAVALGNATDPHGLAAAFFYRMLVAQPAQPVRLRGFISGSRFQFQDDGVSPMLFISTGVGFTAMRGILQDRLAKQAEDRRANTVGLGGSPTNHVLFLGTANEDSVVFRDDLRRWEQQLVLKVHFAFSNEHRHPRRYVQDVVASRVDEIVQVVGSSHGSRIFVCGRAAMVRRIREVFEADQLRRRSRWFDTIHASGRYLEEGYG